MALIPGLSRSRLWVGLPLGMAALALPALLTLLLGGGPNLAAGLGVLAALTTLAVRLLLRCWSWIAAQLFASALLSALAYLVYAGALTALENLGALGLAASVALLLLEMSALSFSLYYLFEMLDVLGVRDRPLPPPARDFTPAVALQVPTYNEPVEVVARTLDALARLEYPHLMVQVVDNNTTDPALWRPLQEYCRRLGPRFNFIHLENWPGYKAGALNEATRRLPPDVEVIGIVDSDYTIQPEWLHEVVGYFADPGVAFVQTPQDYRDWKDEPYLRGLYYSYRYFFVLSMPSRARRNAIIFAGTMGLLRRRALEAVGGWDETCITEDAEASLRMLGTGWSGVYVPRAGGRGMMPLTFDGLKKQRFRWALGGIQILRRHWRDLVGIGDLRLTAGQRFHYLMSGLSWFGDLLQVFFTVLLVTTAVAATVHHQLPIRQVTAAVLAIPLAMLVTGVARALWALRASTGCSFRDAVMAMRVWFSLSWITAMACVRGLLRYQTAFLRTPKAPERAASWLRALAASRTETVVAVATGLAGVAMLVRSPSVATLVLAVLVVWQASVYANAPLAGLAAEGIHITPERRRYLRSSRTTGDRVTPARWAIAVPSAAVVFAVVVAFLLAPLFTQTGSSSPPSGPMLAPPTAIPVASRSPRPTPSPTGTPVATPTPSPAPAPTAAPTTVPTAVSTPAPGGGPSPRPSPPTTP